MQRISAFFESIRRFAGEDRAAVFGYVAFTLPVLLGLGGLGIDVAMWHTNNREIQSIADSAALAGALENVKERISPQIVERVKFDAEWNGAEIDEIYSDLNGTTATTTVTSGAPDDIEVYWPPQISTLHNTNTAMVEVVVERTVPTLLLRRFMDDVTVSARAVALGDILDSCVVSLAPDDGSGGPSLPGVYTIGNPEVELECGIIANSVDNNALDMGGTSCIRVIDSLVKVVGNYQDTSSNGDATCHPNVLTGVAPFRDPMSYLQPPGPTGLNVWDGVTCSYSGMYTANSGTRDIATDPLVTAVSPNVYVFCGNVRSLNGGKIIFPADSLIIIDGGGLEVNNGGTLDGQDGVTFWLTNGGNNDDVGLNGGITRLIAPDNGPYAGVLFVVDNTTPDFLIHTIQGNGALDIVGIFYAPYGIVSINGGGAGDNNRSLVISYRIRFAGNAVMGDFDGTVLEDNTHLIQSNLVE
jgi:Flp pilus assembly protein TadG